MLENFSMLLSGLATALTPYNLIACVIGGILGIFVGALPGIGAVAGCSLLLPITYKMDPTAAIIMLAGIYYGNMFGGAYSAILLNIPGDSPAVMTAVEGYPLTKRGQAGRALFTANVSSFIGGTVGIICLTMMGPLLADIGLKFGPAEMASLTFLALTSIGWMLGDDPKKGLIATGIGVMISTIGMDASSAQFRYTFGSTGLLSGINFIPLVVGMFGFSQVLSLATSKDNQDALNIGKLRIRDSLLNGKEMLALIPQCIRTALLGGFVGFLPGAGGTTGSFLAYMMERKINRNRHKMGTEEGSIEGISAVEASNNAASVGAFIPLLSLGIPGSSTTAVLLGGLMAWGLKPGPLLFQQEAEFCWSLIGSMYLGNVVCLIFGLAIIPFLVKLMKVPKNILIPIITMVCIVGAYADSNSMFDVWIMLISGVLAFMLQKKGIPMTPVILSFVLAPTFELKVRQALEISNCDMTVFIRQPISLFFLLFAACMCMAPVAMNLFKKVKAKKGA